MKNSTAQKFNIKGFTLIETLIASLILTLATITVCGSMAGYIDDSRKNRNYEQAWELLDQQLTIIEAMGLEFFIEQDRTQGQLETAFMAYQWQIYAEQSQYDNLYRVDAVLAWPADQPQRHISLTTFMTVSQEFAASNEL
jgi:type II secretory pathway pseudopilin PulG